MLIWVRKGGPMACTPCSEQGRILSRYLNRWNFLSAHLHLSPSLATSTYLSEAHGSSSTIDHILCPSHLLSSFSDCAVAEVPLNMSDHLPVLSTLKVVSQLLGPVPALTQAVTKSYLAPIGINLPLWRLPTYTQPL